MCTIRLYEIIEQHQHYPDAGSALYHEIVENLDDDRIIIDSENVRGIPTLLLNTSIGRLIDEFGYENLKGKIGFTHIGKTDAETIRKYINRYTQKSGV